jgi:hypothetical protein
LDVGDDAVLVLLVNAEVGLNLVTLLVDLDILE